jgi:uncharacterized damage-inducible protein DinB
MPDRPLLEALLDSWDRSNTILINLLRILPEGTLDLSPAEGSPAVGKLFMHMHYCRLIFIQEDAPEFARPLPEGEWRKERDPRRIEALLNESAEALRDAVRGRLASGKAMDRHYDHPILLLQHMLWHEGYHHGQIKLALKLAGQALDDEVAGPVTWDVWMDKTG